MRPRFGYPAMGRNMEPRNEEETRFHLIDPVLRLKGCDDPQRILAQAFGGPTAPLA